MHPPHPNRCANHHRMLQHVVGRIFYPANGRPWMPVPLTWIKSWPYAYGACPSAGGGHAVRTARWLAGYGGGACCCRPGGKRRCCPRKQPLPCPAAAGMAHYALFSARTWRQRLMKLVFSTFVFCVGECSACVQAGVRRAHTQHVKHGESCWLQACVQQPAALPTRHLQPHLWLQPHQ